MVNREKMGANQEKYWPEKRLDGREKMDMKRNGRQNGLNVGTKGSEVDIEGEEKHHQRKH